MDNKLLDKLVLCIIQLNEAKCLELTKKLLDLGYSPDIIMNICQKALKDINEKYNKGEYYIAGLVMAGEILKNILAILDPYLNFSQENYRAKVLLGTVCGDIHDIGKNITAALLKANGFLVKDLGVDVKPEVFLSETNYFQPDVIGLSVFLSSCWPSLKATIDLLREKNYERKKPYIYISGAMANNELLKVLSPDYIVFDANETLKLCEKLSTNCI